MDSNQAELKEFIKSEVQKVRTGLGSMRAGLTASMGSIPAESTTDTGSLAEGVTEMSMLIGGLYQHALRWVLVALKPLLPELCFLTDPPLLIAGRMWQGNWVQVLTIQSSLGSC
jgi:hypothetical protein